MFTSTVTKDELKDVIEILQELYNGESILTNVKFSMKAVSVNEFKINIDIGFIYEDK